MECKQTIHLERGDIETWAARSRKGEVCGIFGCSGEPVIKCGHCNNHYCREHCFVIAQLGHRILTHPKCVVCGASYSGGRELTCSDACHEELANRMVSIYGEFKKIIRASTGEAFKVPTRDIIERGVREQELDQYPRWEASHQ
jgi:hypothetical protein